MLFPESIIRYYLTVFGKRVSEDMIKNC